MPAALLALTLTFLAAVGARAQEPPTLEVFSRPGCPHCARAEDFLAALAQRHAVQITRHDVSRDRAARARLQSLAQTAGVAPGVPAFYARERLLLGFRDAETTGRELETLLFAGAVVSPLDAAIDVPLLGNVRPSDFGLPLFTVVIGLLDGFNPCAMWVLLFPSMQTHCGMGPPALPPRKSSTTFPAAIPSASVRFVPRMRGSAPRTRACA